MAEQAEHGAGRDVEVEVAQRPQVAEALARGPRRATPARRRVGSSASCSYGVLLVRTWYDQLSSTLYEWQATIATPSRPGRSTPRAGAPTDGRSDRVAEKIAEKIGERLSGTLERKSAKRDAPARALERHAAKAAKKAEALDRIAAHLGALDVWTRVEPAARAGRASRATRSRPTAIRIADAEGFDAVSMRRIAAELDAGTMTLYHYVRTKDELLTLVTDAVMGEVVVPPDEPMPDDWRDALTLLAERSRAALQRHPWILDITDDPPIGPNSVRHFDQSLQAVASLADQPRPRSSTSSPMVDEYVFGYCLQERNNAQPDTPASTAT